MLLVVPLEDFCVDDYVAQLGLDRAEVAVTWEKDGVDIVQEMMLAKAAVVVQCSARFSRKFPHVANPWAIDDALRERVHAALPDAYVSLHHHDEFSIRDGLGRVEDLVKLLKAQGRSFCCVTNHGSVGGWIRQYKACREAGIKAIFGCLTPGQPIFAKNGVKKIEDVRVGDEVLTHNGRFQRVVGCSKRNYSGTVYRIECWGESGLEVTGEHPVMVYGKTSHKWEFGFSWEKPEDIKFGRANMRCSAARSGSKVRGLWRSYAVLPRIPDTEESMIKVLDWVVGYENREGKAYRTRNGPNDTVSNRNFPVEIALTGDWMRMFGLYVAEGSQQHGTVRWTFNNLSDVRAIDFLRTFLKSELGLELVCAGEVSFTDKNGNERVSQASDYYVCSVILQKMMLAMFGAGAKEKKFPISFLGLNKSLLAAFIWGLWEGDANKRGDVLTTSSWELAHLSRLAVAKVKGAAYQVSCVKNGEFDRYDVRWGRTANTDEVYTDSDDSFVYLPIRNVDRRWYDGPVYNLHVEEDNSYVSGVAVHNCEMYVNDYRGDDPELKKASRRSSHLILTARTEEGLYNLIRIHNDAQLDGFYYMPRMNHEAARRWGKGIVATSACLSGEVPRLLMAEPPPQRTPETDVEYEQRCEVAKAVAKKAKTDYEPPERDTGETDAEYLAACAVFVKAAREEAERIYRLYEEAFDEFYVELQIIEYEEQREVNRRLIEFGREVGAKFMLASDSHYLDATHANTHDLLLMMRQGKTVLDKRESEEEVWNFQVANLYYRDAAAMRDVFENGFVDKKGGRHGPFRDDVFTEEVFVEAMANTRRVAVAADPIRFDPTIQLPKLYDNGAEMLRRKVNAGFGERGIGRRVDVQDYLDRVRHEFAVITKLGWADYFLIMDRIVADAKEKFGEWAVGYGRGSAAGSLVSYCLGLTDCDPLEHGLLFERFLDEGRRDAPDIDTDFDPRVREWVKGHIVKVFGEDNVCSIGTYSTYKTRAVILGVARVLALDVHEANAVTKKLEPLKSFEVGDEGDEEIVDKMDLDDVCAHYPELADYLDRNPEVRFHAEIIRNQVSNMGKHAGGVIISGSSLKGRIPVLRDSKGGILSAWAESGTVQELSELGLVKYDILGLNNLPVIADCISFIEDRHGVRPIRDEIPIDDRNSIRQEARRDLVGIFQFENPATMPIVAEVGMESLNDVAAITSLIRPGPKDMGMDMEYARRKHGQPYEVLDCIREILAPTYGIIVYQEQMMQISQALCGFDGPKANRLRRACGKKNVELMRSVKEDFVNGAQPRIDSGEVTTRQVEDLWELVVKFAKYGFNKSHAITYSAITTVELWLKHNYLVEYMAALLNNTKQGKKKHGSSNILVRYVNYARRRGIDMLPPDVSRSGVGFRLEGPSIRFSLGHVKNVATSATEIEAAQPFTGIEDFNARVMATVNRKQKDGTYKATKQKLNKRVFESLLYAGAFDSFGARNEVAAKFAELRKQKTPPVELSDDEWLEKEREMCGLVMSVDPLVKRCGALISEAKAQTIGEEAIRDRVRLFGRIDSIVNHTSRNGNPMWKVFLDDGIDSIMFYVFEGGKQRFKDEFETGDVALVPMKRFEDGGQRFFDDDGDCVVFTKEDVDDAEAGRLSQG